MRSRLLQIKDWNERAETARYSVRKLAKYCDSSPRQLERFFLESAGLSPHRCLNELRQQKALELVRGELTLKEIAARLGYSQPANFSRDFKRFHGVSPAEIKVTAAQMSRFDMKCRVLITDLASQPADGMSKSASGTARSFG